MEVLGESLISELGRRGQRGMHLNFDAYQTLRRINNVEEMQAFLDSEGFRSVLAADDPVWLADGLEEAVADETPPRTKHRHGGPVGRARIAPTGLRHLVVDTDTQKASRLPAAPQKLRTIPYK